MLPPYLFILNIIGRRLRVMCGCGVIFYCSSAQFLKRDTCGCNRIKHTGMYDGPQS